MSGSDSITPGYGLTLPAIGGSQDSWGNKTNANWQKVDGLLGALLPKTGGVISGSLDVAGHLGAGGDIGCQGTVVTNHILCNNEVQTSGFMGCGGNFGCGGQASIQTNLTLNTGNGFKPGGGSWAATSDERAKRDIQPYAAGLAEITALAPISFSYNGDGGTVADGVTYHGLSAQRTQAIMPELVFRQDNGYLATQLGPLTLALVNACRELAGRVRALEAACPG